MPWLLLLACAQPEAVPRDLDTLVHDVWIHYAERDDEALLADVRDLREIVDEAALPTEGTFSDLSEEEAAVAGAEDVDPEPAVGMSATGFVDCTPAQMEAILVSLDQDVLYPENYVTYERTYTSDAEAFDAGEATHLSWDADYEIAPIPLFGAYSASILGGAHRVDDGEDGPYLLSTTVMPSPADGEPDTVVFDVDFQLEVFYPDGAGMVHLFVMWRHIVSGDLSTDDEGMVNLIIDGMHDWDADTASICTEGRI